MGQTAAKGKKLRKGEGYLASLQKAVFTVNKLEQKELNLAASLQTIYILTWEFTLKTES